jgi:flagellin
MNSHRNLLINNAGTAKNLEKLSSGYRVNRAGDDAAGLAISEKMRGQIRGLDMATRNAQNGVSLIQTAEGALNETHAILQRMRELAVQSSNGTYQEEVDRANLDKEVQALKSEIERISTSTHYNGIKLIDGSMTDPSTASTNKAKASAYAAPGATDQPLNITDHGITVKSEGVPTVIGDTTFKPDDGFTGTAGLRKVDGVQTVTAEEMTFQIGANGSGDQRVELSVTNMGVWNLGDRTMKAADIDTNGTSTTKLSGNMVAHVDISTRSKANDSIRVLDAAINQVSGTRADLGAMQNRLEHTINNLGVAKENLQSAESSIRDVDMAKEMMEFTKNNILTQASQSMLAQANQLPSGVLQLLR